MFAPADSRLLLVLAVGLPLAVLILAVLWLNRSLVRTRAHLEAQLAEREKAEEALRASEAFYQSLVETLPQNIFRKDREGRFTFANARFCASLGRDCEEIIGKTDFDFFPASLAQAYRRSDVEVMETGAPFETVEEHVTSSGESISVEVKKTPLFDPDSGAVIGTQGIFWDVTERKRAAQALQAAEERLRTVIRNAPVIVFALDGEGIFTFSDGKGLEALGLEPGQVVGQSVFDVYRDAPEVVEHIRRAFRGESTAWSAEIGGLTFETRCTPLRYRGGDRVLGLIGVATDITERRRAEAERAGALEELHEKNQLLEASARLEREAYDALKKTQSQLVQAEKLAGLGQMVAGVAHEINNPLAFVSNNVTVLERDVRALGALLDLYRGADALIERDQPALWAGIRDLAERIDPDYTIPNLGELLGRSREGLRRIQQIVRDLRDFARLDESDLTEADLNAGIASTINIIQGLAHDRRVELARDLSPDLPRVTGYPAKINQVVMNLLANAIQASDAGGTVTIRTRPEGGGVCIEVTDTGHGIDPAVRDRIFDPFFTTKPPGEGTGLGLSISYGIIEAHGGRIEVESEPGQGARFTVRLPLRPDKR